MKKMFRVGGILLGMGAVSIYFSIQSIQLANAQTEWVKGNAKVVSVTERTNTRAKKTKFNRRSKSKNLYVGFEYEVDANPYSKIQRVSWPQTDREAFIDEWLEREENGELVEFIYDPENPERATLEASEASDSYQTIGMGIVLFIVGGILMGKSRTTK